MNMFRRILCLLSLIVLIAISASAQIDKGALSGAVTDNSGAVVAGAKISAKNIRTGVSQETVSTSSGLYVFPNLEPGTYTISYEQAGFKKLSRSNIVIAVGNRTVTDVQLEVGDVSQSVTITEAPPQLNTATTEVGVSFAPKLFTDAPVSGAGLRSIEAFIGFQPGVVNGAGAEGGISGGARRSKEILVDGAGMTNPESGGVAFNGLPAFESIGEFRLINNTFAAEYGRTGGGIESFVTKSGGNQFHGNVFDFHTSSVLNAASWAGKANSNAANPIFKKPSFHGNNYGATLGGPIYLPKKVFGPLGGYNEDKTKTFFLFTTDNFRRASASSSFITLPTVKMRAGDFSEYTNKVIYDPITRLPFASNRIDPSRFSAVSKNILPLIPLPTNGNLVQNYLQTTSSVNKQDSWSIKINQNFSSRHLFNMYLSKQYIGSVVTGPLPDPLLGANGNAFSPNKPLFARFGYDWVITPTMNLHLSYGITKLRSYFENQSVGKGWPQRLGLKGVQQSGSDAFPVVNFAGVYQALADTNGTKTNGTQFNNTDHARADLSWVKGNFNWKFGADMRWMRTTGEKLPSGAFDDAGVQGVFNFNSNETALGGAGGDPFASFLLGVSNSSSRTYNGTGISAKFGYNGWYAQTDWRLRPNLTLNFGMRYELPTPRQTDPIASFTSFDPTVTDPRSGLKGALAYLGDCTGCNGKDRFGDIDYSSFGPRLGLAWSIGQKTVVRLGYGIYYAAGNGLMGGFCLRCATGFATVASGVGGSNWDNGFIPTSSFLPPPIISPSAGNAADEIYYISPKSGTAPRFQNWSIGIQRELPMKFVAEVTYIGNRGTRLSANHFSLNLLDAKYYALGDLLTKYIDDPAVVAAGYRAPYTGFIADWGKASTSTGATLARALRPYPHINGPVSDEYNPVGSSWYDSLQVKLDRRFGNFFVEANYTWSKSLTNASGSQTGGDSNNRNPKTDRSISTLGQDGVLAFEKSLQYTDYPHIFNVVMTYDLPFGKGKKFLGNNGFVDRLVGGWTVSFVGNYTSGALILLNAQTNSYPNWGFAYGRKRVNIVPGKAIQTGISRQDLDPRKGLSGGVYDRSVSTNWFNNDFYTIPGTYELGNAPVYLTQLRNPNAYNDNMGFIKRTRISETVNFELRAEFFNVFNRTNFGFGGTPFRPATGTGTPVNNFGIPGGVRTSERTGQVMARINF